MTIVQRTGQRLILRSRPWKLGLLMIAGMLIFAAIGLAEWGQGRPEEAGKLALLFGLFAVSFIVFIRQEVAIFDRPSGLVVLRRAGMFGQTETQRPLDGLTKAVVGTDEGGDPSNPRTLTRAVLISQDGLSLPMSDVFSSGPSAGETVKVINAWLKGRG